MNQDLSNTLTEMNPSTSVQPLPTSPEQYNMPATNSIDPLNDPACPRLPVLSDTNLMDNSDETNQSTRRRKRGTKSSFETDGNTGMQDQQQESNGIKPRKWINKEIVKDKEGTYYYCYTYLVKTKTGVERPQKVYIKKVSKSSKKQMTDPSKMIKPNPALAAEMYEGKSIGDNLENSFQFSSTFQTGMDNIVGESKERKKTRELQTYIRNNIDRIRAYNKFVVTRVLQDFKKDYPESKVSYGLVKKTLDAQGLLDAQKNKNY